MKTNKILTSMLLMALVGCRPSVPTAQNSAEQQATADTLAVSTTVRHTADSTGSYAIGVAFPVENRANALLCNAVREWISEQLGGTFGDTISGSYAALLADTAALVSHYFDRTIESNHAEFAEMQLYNPQAKTDGIQYLDSTTISKAAEGAQWVTFEQTHEVYTGGAHGGYTVFGQTFRKQDGRRMGWDLLVNTYDEEFQSLLKQGLMEYWQLKDEAQLEGNLMGQANIYYIPLPQCPPLFTKDGISFVYNQYEIASYADGLPSFTVPYSKLRPFLNATARQLIREK